jgi:hypothetical protein
VRLLGSSIPRFFKNLESMSRIKRKSGSIFDRLPAREFE